MEESMSRIPQTDSISELAQFWDTHDLTDFEDVLEEVKERVFERQTGTIVPVPLCPDEAEAVRRIARSRGMDDKTLIHEWVIEKLRTN